MLIINKLINLCLKLRNVRRFINESKKIFIIIFYIFIN